MDERKQQILSAVIEEYSATGLPVGSDVISENYVDASSATIRAEMSDLEREEYLFQPHISAGRVPTDKGFRFYVDKLMKEKPLSEKEQKELQLELLEAKAQHARLARTTAKLLSNFAKSFAITGLLNEGDHFESGIKEFLASSDFTQLDQVVQAAEILDYLDEWVDKVIAQSIDGGAKIYIGKENPILKLHGYSMIISKYDLPDGKQGYIAIVGPKRMKYGRNLSLIEYVKKLLSN